MREARDYIFITLGLFSYALGWAAFLIPYQITTGGTTGIGAIIYYATGFPIQWSYFIINAVLMTFAIKILGPKFSIKTTYAIFMLTFLLWFLQLVVNGADGFSKGRSRITAWVARFLLKRSWRTVPVARYLTNVSVCFIQLSKSCGESVLLSCKSRCRAGKRGLNKSCSAVTACYSSVSNGISKSKIILISASLISPFNSISTTI